jgi:hypothetical protein
LAQQQQLAVDVTLTNYMHASSNTIGRADVAEKA